MLNVWKTAGAAVIVTAALFAVVPSAHSANPVSLPAATDDPTASSEPTTGPTDTDPNDTGLTDVDAADPDPDADPLGNSLIETDLVPDPGTETSEDSEDSESPPVEKAESVGMCDFTTAAEYIQFSPSAREVSGKGWWLQGTCTSATRAVVTMQLQQRDTGGRWENVGTPGKAEVRPGGGRGDRVTGRATCTSSTKTTWRGVVDVDLIGERDDPGKLRTAARVYACK
ncbi:hypothetical protein [Nonomuraea insulae]|uniref:Uncharacterized protein n=1 Tax=Nonomuraea insulae TaxID=1616787 RepID=A0ABW1CMC5_9ACTN